MRKLKLLGLLFLCCCLSPITYGTDKHEGEEKENITPNLPNLIENQVKKNPTIQGNINERNLPTDSNTLNLRGHLTAEALQKLKSPYYTEIKLHFASGEEDNESFYKDYLIVSPKIINPDVRSLSLSICGLRDENIKEIGGFKNLEELYLSTNALTDNGVESIRHLKNLRILNLHSNEIGNKFLESLANSGIHLTELNISCNNKVTDEGIKHIVEKISTLKKLDISCNKISRGMYEKIKKMNPHLEVEYFPG